MAQALPAQHSPAEAPKRPRGILKNSDSYQQTSPEGRVSPIASHSPSAAVHEPPADISLDRPGMPPRELSEKEIVQMNTELNAGGHRRNSSNPRGSIPRRQSSHSAADGASEQEQHEMRLKWDEANLWLNEGQMGGKMKIDEPKTPYAKHYDPAEDEEEVSAINAEELAVDELDMEKSKSGGSTNGTKKKMREDEIPGLDLGEPELEHEPAARRESDGDRRVTVDNDTEMDGMAHGEEELAHMTKEERDKHHKFEQMRKKHYEMKNIKGLLGHPEALDLDEDEER